MVINTTGGPADVKDSFTLRRSALESGIPYFTTASAATAAAEGIRMFSQGSPGVLALQDLHESA